MDTAAEQRQGSTNNLHQQMSRHLAAGGLRQIMPGTTILWGRRIPGQMKQLIPSQHGRLVAGVPVQAVIAATSSYSVTMSSKQRVTSTRSQITGGPSGIAASREPQQQHQQQQSQPVQPSHQEPTQQQQQRHTNQQIQQLEEQQGSTEGPSQTVDSDDNMASEVESDESSEGPDVSAESAESAGEALEVQQQDGKEDQSSNGAGLEEEHMGTGKKRRRLVQ